MQGEIEDNFNFSGYHLKRDRKPTDLKIGRIACIPTTRASNYGIVTCSQIVSEIIDSCNRRCIARVTGSNIKCILNFMK